MQRCACSVSSSRAGSPHLQLSAGASLGMADSVVSGVLPKVQLEYAALVARRQYEGFTQHCNKPQRASLRSHACTAVASFLLAFPRTQNRTVNGSTFCAARRAAVRRRRCRSDTPR
jgi:hypothetical protein